MKGKSHNRNRSGVLKRIRRGQARKLRAMERREGYDRQQYDGQNQGEETPLS